jgi:hypothetical protein
LNQVELEHQLAQRDCAAAVKGKRPGRVTLGMLDSLAFPTLWYRKHLASGPPSPVDHV